MSSLQHLLHLRKKCPEFGWEKYRVVPGGHHSVVALRFEWRDAAVIALHNLSPRSVKTAVEVAAGEKLVTMAADRSGRADADLRHLTLDGYGYRWFRIQGNGWHNL